MLMLSYINNRGGRGGRGRENLDSRLRLIASIRHGGVEEFTLQLLIQTHG